MVHRDFIGSRGENICSVLLTKLCYGRRLPFFKTIFLGEKFETLDLMVELIGAGEVTPFFFVQVKSTRGGYTRQEKRLKVKVSQEDMKRLRLYPTPTYVVGIDEVKEVGYIISANEGCPIYISSLSTRFELDCDNLARLWNEVQSFWSNRDMSFPGSLFSE